MALAAILFTVVLAAEVFWIFRPRPGRNVDHPQ
jgi:hypothetical protein